MAKFEPLILNNPYFKEQLSQLGTLYEKAFQMEYESGFRQLLEFERGIGLLERDLAAAKDGAAGFDLGRSLYLVPFLSTRLPKSVPQNLRRGSSLEYLHSKDTIVSYKKSLLSKAKSIFKGDELNAVNSEINARNYAKLEGQINGIRIDQYRASGDVFEGKPIFSPLKIDKEGGINTSEAWSREWDMEYVMLSEVARDLKATKGGKYPDVVGEVILTSDIAFCLSCQGVILEFAEMFPNVRMILIDALR